MGGGPTVFSWKSFGGYGASFARRLLGVCNLAWFDGKIIRGSQDRFIMVVGAMRVWVVIRGARSLKEKRRVIKSLKDRVISRFNVSIAEVGDHEVYQSALMGVCVVAVDTPGADSQLQKVFEFISGIVETSGVSTEFNNIRT